MGGRALAISVDSRKIENAGLAGSQQFLAGKLRRGVKITALTAAIGLYQVRGESMKMGLVAGRDLEAGALDLDKFALREPRPDGSRDFVAGQQERPPVAVPIS
jgi:hypothetical protein